MDKGLARDVVRSVFKSGRELESLLPILKQRCTESDYVVFRQQIAKAIDGIHSSVLKSTLDKFPELNAEIEANLAVTGQAMPE